MTAISFKITIPKANEKWWKSSQKELNKMVEEHHKKSWAAQKDPVDGKSWAPRKQPTGSWPILKKSGKMLGTTKFKSDQHPMMFKATTNVKYGHFHQDGTSRMPQRRWLGLGSDFTDRFSKVVAKHIFKGKVTYSTK